MIRLVMSQAQARKVFLTSARAFTMGHEVACHADVLIRWRQICKQSLFGVLIREQQCRIIIAVTFRRALDQSNESRQYICHDSS